MKTANDTSRIPINALIVRLSSRTMKPNKEAVKGDKDSMVRVLLVPSIFNEDK